MQKTMSELFAEEEAALLAAASTPEEKAKDEQRMREATARAEARENEPNTVTDPYELGQDAALRCEANDPPDDLTDEDRAEWILGYESVEEEDDE